MADLLTMTDEQRERHERIRAELFRGIVEDGKIHSQPFSEGISPGATSGIATRAVPVDGGFLVTGRKIFASLSGAADFYNVTAQVRGRGRHPLPRRARHGAMGCASRGRGIRSACGARSRARSSWTGAFVPAEHEWLPPGLYDQAAERYPFLFMSLAPTYLGVTRGICDFTRSYLRGELPGMTTGARRDVPQKQDGWARMQVAYERSRALLFAAADDATRRPVGGAAAPRRGRPPSTPWRPRPRWRPSACGCAAAQAMLRHLALERMYRDARLGSLMLPWSAEVCLERLGRARLY